MAWFSGKVSLGNFPDLAGAVNKFSESVKNIEKNFDSALGFEGKDGSTTSTTEASGSWPSDLMAFMGQKGEDSSAESTEKLESSSPHSPSFSKEKDVSDDNSPTSVGEHHQSIREENVETLKPEEHENHPAETHTEVPEEANNTTEKPVETYNINSEHPVIADEPLETIVALSEVAENVAESSKTTNMSISDDEAATTAVNLSEPEVDLQAELSADRVEQSEFVNHVLSMDNSEVGPSKESESIQDVSTTELNPAPDSHKDEDGLKTQSEDTSCEISADETVEPSNDGKAGNVTELIGVQSVTLDATNVAEEVQLPKLQSSDDVSVIVPEVVSNKDDANSEVRILNQLVSVNQSEIKEQRMSSESNSSVNAESMAELEKVTREMKMMETALLGAARQAQAKADEIAKLMNENEQLKSIIEDQRGKSTEADIESLREEYHQRVSALERKVYALTKERDTLRREQNKKSDAAALLKEKDEIITQIMAEGEGLSKKQAAQESLIRKLRAQLDQGV